MTTTSTMPSVVSGDSTGASTVCATTSEDVSCCGRRTSTGLSGGADEPSLATATGALPDMAEEFSIALEALWISADIWPTTPDCSRATLASTVCWYSGSLPARSAIWSPITPPTVSRKPSASVTVTTIAGTRGRCQRRSRLTAGASTKDSSTASTRGMKTSLPT